MLEIKSDGAMIWTKNNKLHRDKFPAVIYPDGSCEYYTDGKMNSHNNLPAAIYLNHSIHWYVDSKRHKEHDLPASIYEVGELNWRENGLISRTIFPGIINVLTGIEIF